MKHQPVDKKAIVNFCRAHYADNSSELKIVEEFDRDYRPDKAIWWYTRECFTYQMLNRALRLLESDIIIDMGFFIHDLHQQLKELHQQQLADYHGPPLTLYRGQALSVEIFSKLQKSRGGLLAFNSFLSTSKSRLVSLDFARQCSSRDDTVGILFVMTVDPTLRSAVFADINKHSYYEKENEVLFSMHTVFRVEDVVRLDNEQRLLEARLTLTNEDDVELTRLTDRIEEDIGGGTGWNKLARVLLNVGQLNKAEEIYLILLEQQPNESDRAFYYHQLGLTKSRQGAYKDAVSYYNKALAIQEKILPANHPVLATSYNNIGGVYSNIGEYSEALSYLNKALAIQEKTLPVNHPDFASSYNNIGLVHSSMGEYAQALSYLNKALAMREKTLPVNHPSLATSYNNIGGVYWSMGEYSQALSYYNKALAIREKTLPANHPSLATSYNNIGVTYYHLEEYSKARTYVEKTLSIRERSLPHGHRDTQSSQAWLESVNKRLPI